MFVRDDCPADCAGLFKWVCRAAAREASAFRTSMIVLVIVRDCAGYCADCAGAYSLHLAICGQNSNYVK